MTRVPRRGDSRQRQRSACRTRPADRAERSVRRIRPRQRAPRGAAREPPPNWPAPPRPRKPRLMPRHATPASGQRSRDTPQAQPYGAPNYEPPRYNSCAFRQRRRPLSHRCRAPAYADARRARRGLRQRCLLPGRPARRRGRRHLRRCAAAAPAHGHHRHRRGVRAGRDRHRRRHSAIARCSAPPARTCRRR